MRESIQGVWLDIFYMCGKKIDERIIFFFFLGISLSFISYERNYRMNFDLYEKIEGNQLFLIFNTLIYCLCEIFSLIMSLEIESVFMLIK